MTANAGLSCGPLNHKKAHYLRRLLEEIVMRWYRKRNDGWPRKVVEKPYSNEFGAFHFMPRHIKPQKAFNIAMRRLQRELNA